MADIVVYGKGKTGQSLIKMLQQLGKNAILFDDDSGFEKSCRFAPDTTVILSPGVPPRAKGLVAAKAAGATVVGELDFCFPYCKAKCVSVTGTNGKTTICQMIARVLATCVGKVRLLGNGGVPFSSQVLSVQPEEIVVLESSSFQLADCKVFAPYVSVVSNVACDHLNWHPDLQHYRDAKANNFLHQRQGFAIFNLDDEGSVQLSERCGTKKLFYALSDTKADCFFDGENVVLHGVVAARAPYLRNYAPHNISNALAALLACHCVGADMQASADALCGYVPLPSIASVAARQQRHLCGRQQGHKRACHSQCAEVFPPKIGADIGRLGQGRGLRPHFSIVAAKC